MSSSRRDLSHAIGKTTSIQADLDPGAVPEAVATEQRKFRNWVANATNGFIPHQVAGTTKPLPLRGFGDQRGF